MKGTGVVALLLGLPFAGWAQGTDEHEREATQSQPQDYTVELTFVGLGAGAG